jgi:hypothetical protein
VLSAAQGSRAAAGGPSSSSTSSQTLSNLQPGLQPEAARALQQQLARSFAAARILEGGQCRDHPGEGQACVCEMDTNKCHMPMI